MIRPYLRDMINNHKSPIKLKPPSGEIIDDDTFGEWKIHLTMHINFISSRDSGEIRTMYSKSDNIEIMMGSGTDDIIDELSESVLQRYHENLEEAILFLKVLIYCIIVFIKQN